MVRLQARVGPEGVRLCRYTVRPVGGDLAARHRTLQQVSDSLGGASVTPLRTGHTDVTRYISFTALLDDQSASPALSSPRHLVFIMLLSGRLDFC